MAPKRKADAKQQSLEEVTGNPATKKRSRKGKLAEPEVKEGELSTDDLVKAKLARKHGNDPAFKEPQKNKATAAEEAHDRIEHKPNYVEINRAPVLTAWVAVVAQREGYSHEASLTFGKAIAGMLAQSKGRSIGVYEAKEQDETAEDAKRRSEDAPGVEQVDVFGMRVKALEADGELRALESGSDRAIDSTKVQQYLRRAFKDRLGDVEAVMKELAEAFPTGEIGREAYHLYEQFRPSVAAGKQGWGRKGRLEFDRLLELKPSD